MEAMTSRIIRVAPDVPAAMLRHELGDDFIFGDIDDVPAIWGDGAEVLWPTGEALWLAGGVGVGKSTILQQLIFHGIGVRSGPLLGYSVRFPEGIVGYVAADRPSQIRRSMRRMVTQADAPLIGGRLDVWRGAFPFDVALAAVGDLADFVIDRGWSVLAIDSLKDVTSGTTDDDKGLAINRQFQELSVRGIQLVVNHHDRKGDGTRRVKGLDDLYGSRWLGAGAGSVLYIQGEPGADEVEMHHLKIPVDKVGPLVLKHDHASGTTTVAGEVQVRRVRKHGEGKVDALAVIASSPEPLPTAAIATTLGVSRELAAGWLRSLAEDGKVGRTRAGTAASDIWGLA